MTVTIALKIAFIILSIIAGYAVLKWGEIRNKKGVSTIAVVLVILVVIIFILVVAGIIIYSSKSGEKSANQQEESVKECKFILECLDEDNGNRPCRANYTIVKDFREIVAKGSLLEGKNEIGTFPENGTYMVYYDNQDHYLIKGINLLNQVKCQFDKAIGNYTYFKIYLWNDTLKAHNITYELVGDIEANKKNDINLHINTLDGGIQGITTCFAHTLGILNIMPRKDFIDQCEVSWANFSAIYPNGTLKYLPKGQFYCKPSDKIQECRCPSKHGLTDCNPNTMGNDCYLNLSFVPKRLKGLVDACYYTGIYPPRGATIVIPLEIITLPDYNIYDDKIKIYIIDEERVVYPDGTEKYVVSHDDKDVGIKDVIFEWRPIQRG